MDLQSILGYAHNSPFRNAPYLDITTPEGLITMENTDIDLMGIDNLGNIKKMKARSKNPYKFPGTKVREIPMQQGGISNEIIEFGKTRKEIPPLPANLGKEAENFFRYYINSPKYRERLVSQGYSDPDATIKARSNNIDEVIIKRVDKIDNPVFNGVVGDYDSRNKVISLADKDLSTEVHERSHSTGALGTNYTSSKNIIGHPLALNKTEVNEIESRNLYKKMGIWDIMNIIDPDQNGKVELHHKNEFEGIMHDRRAEEVKADMDTLRFFMRKQGIYDAGKEEFKKEHLQRIKNLELKGVFPTILSHYNDDDFIWLMNNIAKNNQASNPVARKGGRINPYQQGGITSQQMFDFLFDDEEEEPVKGNTPTAPTVEEVDIQNQMDELKLQQRMLEDQQNEELAMSVFNSQMGNPYGSGMRNRPQQTGNPYTGQIMSSGQFGNQNVGQYGAQIYGQLANDLGYAPVANSIYRSKEQQDALIAAGAPAAKNSWHLTGNAIDLKPDDWHKLSDEQQLYYRRNYDVVYHNNHYHIEPK